MCSSKIVIGVVVLMFRYGVGSAGDREEAAVPVMMGSNVDALCWPIGTCRFGGYV